MAFPELTSERRHLTDLMNELIADEVKTAAVTKWRMLLAGLVSVGSTVLFGGTALAMDGLRKRIQRQRLKELETSIIERERANDAILRADTLHAGKSAALELEIVERKGIEHQLAFATLHDELTGLANRASFTERLDQIALTTYTSEYLWAILFLDLDRFKVINDSLGHMAGDLLLIAVARRLETCLRQSDMLARFSGHKFTILLDGIEDASGACRIAERVLREFESAFWIEGREVFATASIGAATSSNGDERPDDVLRNADIAMYRAKELGKRFELFRPELLTLAVTLLEVETDLARALERGEFRLYYQPIISLGAGCLKGFEALVRWQHPRRGLVSPDEFISVAEDTGAIVAIGEWILQEACRQMQVWRTTIEGAERLQINVNVSAKQLAVLSFSDTVERALSASGLQADGLNLEITESVIMDNADDARAILSGLRALGVRVHLDDFGTGYSSLTYLNKFTIDVLKIDRSFVGNCETGVACPEIVRSIIALGQSLSIDVTAEGIETDDQLVQLRALGCTSGQGYYFSHPTDAFAAGALIVGHVNQVPH